MSTINAAVDYITAIRAHARLKFLASVYAELVPAGPTD